MNWDFIIDLGYLSVFLLVATFLRRKVPVFSKFLIPNSVIAGFLALLFGPELLGLANFNQEAMGNYVYHLLAIGFIALTLKDRTAGTKKVTKVSFFIVAVYLIQAVVGFAITMVLMYSIVPDLFPGFGLLLPLGFGQGPGQAYSIGSQWEEIGFAGGGNIGLSIATIGFLWACFGGIVFLNILIRKHKHTIDTPIDGDESDVSERDTKGDIPLSESIDRLTLVLSLVALVYLLAYAFIATVSGLLAPLGGFGQTIATLLWGFNYLFGILFGLVVKRIVQSLKQKKWMKRNYTNTYLLSRISSTSFDYMVTAAIAAISLQVLADYWLPTLLVTTAGGLVTMGYSYLAAKRVMGGNVIAYALGFYATYTGTLSTGMAFIREVDPRFKSGVAEHLVLASGLALIFAFPLLFLVNFPSLGYTENNPIWYVITMVSLIAYFLVMHFALFWRTGKKRS